MRGGAGISGWILKGPGLSFCGGSRCAACTDTSMSRSRVSVSVWWASCAVVFLLVSLELIAATPKPGTFKKHRTTARPGLGGKVDETLQQGLQKASHSSASAGERRKRVSSITLGMNQLALALRVNARSDDPTSNEMDHRMFRPNLKRQEPNSARLFVQNARLSSQHQD